MVSGLLDGKNVSHCVKTARPNAEKSIASVKKPKKNA